MYRTTTREQYKADYRRARIAWRTYRRYGDNSLCMEARESLWNHRGVTKPVDRIEEFAECWHNPRMRPFLFTGVFHVRKSSYPSPNRFETVIIVKQEPEPLVKSGMVYRAFERLTGGALFPLYMAAETMDELQARVNRHLSHKRPVYVTA